jgi:hypothetical protein
MGLPGPMTHRMFLAWQAWLEMQWNKPTKTDHYLMQIAVEVRRVLAKDPRKIKLDDARLEFSKPGDKKKVPEEVAGAMAMGKWLGSFGGFGAVRIVDSEGQEYRMADEDELAEIEPDHVVEE